MKQFFAVHNMDELEIHRQKWGSLSLSIRVCKKIEGKQMEAQHSPTYYMADETQKHFAPFFIPLDEIRNYFGDSIAIYSNWLLAYTKALIVPGTGGIIVALSQMYFGMCDEVTNKHPYTDKKCESGVDANVLAIPYSVYLALWSVLFLSKWQRRESELKFLWGSEDFEQLQQPRREFIGVLHVNHITHQEEMEHADLNVRSARLFAGSMTAFGFICATAFSAFLASAVALLSSPESRCVVKGAMGAENRTHFNLLFGLSSGAALAGYEDEGLNAGLVERDMTEYTCFLVEQDILAYDDVNATAFPIRVEWVTAWETGKSVWDQKKWGLLASFLNLFIIQVFGRVYEAVAVALNNWENHRTETEYEDSLIIKNFAFQVSYHRSYHH
jgi:hypothetical protein